MATTCIPDLESTIDKGRFGTGNPAHVIEYCTREEKL